ncbi:hypothetical protein A1Q1_08244 [Trichosporon asahii var. asahii CBS 2479]|uniref:Uncharacterized protein n=1 Tax=Trichosporon asahii var. asahii (strain ATCC 90039 / CBS 2479 / JCM 2466 / KCTC 7840 / NBRC 103889/ NCYC 2677 / UAMH 7654) TaxID=1186058 RepID=J6F5W3_TRIAS|nr:hypothetical protein A1Q1_08244 [Trichosporon asahii var. asahii CBS 2479]EJT50692.1 hypothetical protein A1Q1_08244 [Trichosporon asahii var. asahii CBS 2479]
MATNETTPSVPTPGQPGGSEPLPTDVNFYFFLFWYFGVYVAVALCFITSLFGLYRLNWWPQALGGKTTYLLMWAGTLGVGLLSHNLDLFGMRRREHERGPGSDDDEAFEWERKSTSRNEYSGRTSLYVPVIELTHSLLGPPLVRGDAPARACMLLETEARPSTCVPPRAAAGAGHVLR